jgi:hypothetical protein
MMPFLFISGSHGDAFLSEARSHLFSKACFQDPLAQNQTFYPADRSTDLIISNETTGTGYLALKMILPVLPTTQQFPDDIIF